jgi:hypothetical protein
MQPVSVAATYQSVASTQKAQTTEAAATPPLAQPAAAPPPAPALAGPAPEAAPAPAPAPPVENEANRKMPATSAGWLMILLGRGTHSGVGLVLRRRWWDAACFAVAALWDRAEPRPTFC